MIHFRNIFWLVTFCVASCVVRQGPSEEALINKDEIRFKKVRGNNPDGAVLSFGKQGGFDAKWVTCPTVVWDGKQYKMWYSSFYDSKMGAGGIGLASSKDGVNWQRENKGDPVLRVSSGNEFDNGQVMGPEVMQEENGYIMWYTGMAKIWDQSGFGFYRIGLATSDDGINWNRANRGRPVIDTGNATGFDDVQAATPSVIRDHDVYKMWYAAWSPDPDKSHRICVASSSDGKKWIKRNGGRPVTGLMPEFAYGPAVVCYRGDYILFYMALKSASGLFAAKSKDGIHWTMLNGGQPVLVPGTGQDFDSLRVGHPFALVRKGKIMVWYTGYKKIKNDLRLSIGLAIQE